MVLSPQSICRTAVHWHPCFRIIPSRFPPDPAIEDVADAVDLEAVFRVESLTNDRLRDEAGELAFIPREERVSGPGTSYVMAAFTHVARGGGRFTDGTFGAFYAARERPTAVSETVFHRERFLRDMARAPDGCAPADPRGVAFDSVRHPGGECAAAFRPRAISRCRQAEHLGYMWNGE